MSMKYYYYLGIKDDGGKIDIFAPFDVDGKIHPITSAIEDSYSTYETLSIEKMADGFKASLLDYNIETGEYNTEPLDLLDDDNEYMMYEPVEEFLSNYKKNKNDEYDFERIVANAIYMFAHDYERSDKKYFVIREWA